MLVIVAVIVVVVVVSSILAGSFIRRWFGHVRHDL